MQPAQQQPPAYQHGNPQQQTTTIHRHPVVTLQPATSAGVPGGNKRGNWCWRGLRVTGYMQTILGVLAVAFGTAAILMKSYLHLYGIPVGSGICFTLAGILGIAAAGKRSIGLVLGYNMMSVFSALATLGVGGIAGIAASVDRRSCPSYPYPGAQFYSHPCVTSTSARFGVDVCIVLIAIAELVISIAGASLSCCGLSYTRYNPSTLPQPRVTYQTYPQQMVAGAPPQGVYINSGASVTYPDQIAVQPGQTYQPQGHFQPPPEGQFQPPPEGQFQPPPEGQFQPPTEGQFQPPPQGQFHPPPQGQFQPPPQGQFQPPPEGQFQPPPEGQFQPPPEGQFQPPPQGQFQPPPEGQLQPPPEGQFQPPPQGLFQPPPQGQFLPPPQGQFQPPPEGQFQPPPQGQFQPPPEGQMQPPPQQHPEAPLDPSKDKNHYLVPSKS